MWGSSFLLIEIGLEDLDPAAVAFLRLLFGAATLAAIPAARRAVPRGALRPVALLGLVWMGVPFLLFPLAQRSIDSSLAGMLNGAAPLFAAAVAALFFRRAPEGRQLLGLAVGFAGVVAISWPAVQGAEANALGAGLVLLATLLYGVAFNLAEPLERRHGVLPVILRAELFALVLVAPPGILALLDSAFSWPALAAMLGLGCFGTALAFASFTTLVGRVGATRGSVAVYFIPIVAIVLGAAFRAEAVAAISIGGTGLAILGAYLSSRGGTSRGGSGGGGPASQARPPSRLRMRS